jgi:hypothetical protein
VGTGRARNTLVRVDVRHYHCSFCGVVATEIERLVGGPGVTICKACVTRCQQILAMAPEPVDGAPLFPIVFPPNEPGEAERGQHLVSDYLRGDADAFFVIVDQYSALLLEEAEGMLGPFWEPTEAVRETFLRAIAAIRRFDRLGQWQLRPWLSAILRQVWIDQQAEPGVD